MWNTNEEGRRRLLKEMNDRELSWRAVLENDVVKQKVGDVSGPAYRQCPDNGMSCGVVSSYGNPLVPGKSSCKWSNEIEAHVFERDRWKVDRLKWTGGQQGKVLAASQAATYRRT